MSEKHFKEIFEKLKRFGTFGIAFFNSKGKLTFSNLTEEYDQFAKVIIERNFEFMRIPDFFQRAIPELDAKMYLFKLSEQVKVVS